jgi:Fe-S-cluster containining protein
MTTHEAALILERRSKDVGAVPLHFRKTQEHFVALQAHPCPLYDAETKACTVYDIRPYNCRRFACLRPHPDREPWLSDPLSGACVNRDDRLRRSRIARRLLRVIQEKAQPWARAHGWGPHAA